MNPQILSLLLVGQAAAPEPNILQTFGPFLIIMGIFYFLILAPQRKAAKEKETMRNELKKNDEVVTESGIHGEITAIDANTITLRVAPKVEIVFEKGVVSRLVKAGSGATSVPAS